MNVQVTVLEAKKPVCNISSPHTPPAVRTRWSVMVIIWMIKIHVFRVEHQRKDLLSRIAELEERLSIARNESARAKLDSVEARSNLAKVTNQLEKLQKESIKDHKFLKKQLR